MTLQQQAEKEGVTKQAVWARTKKGYLYHKNYQREYYHKKHPKARYNKINI